jgi:hypothetical protein
MVRWRFDCSIVGRSFRLDGTDLKGQRGTDGHRAA